MTTACDLAAEEMGSGVAGALTAVDCIASEVSEQAFSRSGLFKVIVAI